MAHMKEQNKTPEEELVQVKTSNPLDAEVKTLVIRMLKEISEDLNSIKKNPIRNERYSSWNKEQFTGNQR